MEAIPEGTLRKDKCPFESYHRRLQYGQRLVVSQGGHYREFNTAVGAGTLFANTGDENTATGAGALLSNTTGIENTANGAFALVSNTEAFNTATGARAT